MLKNLKTANLFYLHAIHLQTQIITLFGRIDDFMTRILSATAFRNSNYSYSVLVPVFLDEGVVSKWFPLGQSRQDGILMILLGFLLG